MDSTDRKLRAILSDVLGLKPGQVANHRIVRSTERGAPELPFDLAFEGSLVRSDADGDKTAGRCHRDEDADFRRPHRPRKGTITSI